MSINPLLSHIRINDKYNVIQTYTLLRPVIEEVMIQYIIIKFLSNDNLKPSPEWWFKSRNINNEKFRGLLKKAIL